MKTVLPLSQNKFAKNEIIESLWLITFTLLIFFSSNLYAGTRPVYKNKHFSNSNKPGKRIAPGSSKIKGANAQAIPIISYPGPQTYLVNTPIAPLSPTSGGVAASAYSTVPINVGPAFTGPRGVALNFNGDVYVTDYLAGVVKKIIFGSSVVTIGTGFSHPTGLALDTLGNVYVADAGNNTVKMIPVGGGSQVSLGFGFSSPVGVAVDAAGNIYVADNGNQAVKKMNAGGGSPVIIASGYSNIVSIAADAAGNVYFADGGNHNLYKIPAAGGSPVIIGTNFIAPYGIAVDGEGNVYVTDGNNSVIKKVPAGGGAQSVISLVPGTLIGVAVDGNGNLFTADYSNKGIKEVIALGGYHIDAALPAGLKFDGATGIISGTPTVSSPAKNYVITACNSEGSAPATVTIKVNALNISYTSPQIFTTATPIAPLAPASSGVAAAGYSNTPLSIGSGYSAPHGVAMDPAGNIYIADFGNNTVKKIPVGGGPPVSIGSGFNGPIAVSASNNQGTVYVADYNSGTVREILSNGSTSVLAAGFNHPLDIAEAPTGDIYVADNGNNKIKIIKRLPLSVKDLGSYPNPRSVAVDAVGNLYFGEQGNGVIYKLPVVGGLPYIVASGFTAPNSLAIDAVGNLFVADGTTSAIKEVPVNSNSLVTIGPKFSLPNGLVIDGAGNLYVADSFNSTINKIKPVGGYYINALPKGLDFDNATGIISGIPEKFTLSTDYIVTGYNSFGGNSAVVNIKVNDLNIPVVQYTNPPKPYVINTVITPLIPQTFRVAAPGYSNNPVLRSIDFNNVVGIAVDAKGAIYVADAGNNAVKRFFNGVAATLGSGFNHPTGVAVDAKGNVFVADQANNAVKVILSVGGATNIIGSGFSSPSGVAVDTHGNVYVADMGNNAIKKIPFGGGAPIVIGSGFNQPTDVDIDSLGNVYVADAGNSTIKMIPAGGGNIVTLGNGFDHPNSIHVDGAGNVYVADTFNNILRMIPSGGGVPVDVSTAFVKPMGIAVDFTGVIYATDSGTDLVKIIKPVGGYHIYPSLPAGLSLDGITGVISGTPLAQSPATAYYITGYNYTGGDTYIITLQVNLLPPPSFSYSSPQSYTKNVAIPALTPVSIGVSAVNYNNNNPVSMGIGLALPTGVAVDGTGNIYVADSGSGLVKKIQKIGGGTSSIGSGFNTPSGITVDGAGNVYVSDSGNNTVYKIPSGGGATIAIGAGFSSPAGIAVDSAGNVYVADKTNHVIKKIPAGGGAAVIIGSGFPNPSGVATDAYGNVYIADATDNVIKKIPAGGGSPVIIASGFNQVLGVSVDASGNVYVTNYDSNIVNMIPAGGGPMIALGSGFNRPYAVAVDSVGNVYVADYLNNIIKKIVPVGGYYIRPALPTGLSFDSNTGVISGTPTSATTATNYTIIGYNIYASYQATVNIKVNASLPLPSISYMTPQSYTSGTAISLLIPANTGGPVPATIYSQVTRLAGSGAVGNTNGTGTGAGFHGPWGIATDASNNIYVADYSNNQIRKITPGGVVSTLAGSGSAGSANGTGAAASFNGPAGIAVDASGNVYVGDGGNNQIRKITPGGVVSTFAGSLTAGTTNGTGTAAKFSAPRGLAIDNSGNLYVADYSNNEIRKISPGGVVSTLAGSPAAGSTNGTGAGASFHNPIALDADASGNLYVADYSNNEIRKITPVGVVSTLAGSGAAGAANGTGVAASFHNLFGIAVDAAGNIYAGDGGNDLIRRITPGGVVTTLAGASGVAGTTDGTGTGAQFTNSHGVAIDGGGNLYVADYGKNVIRKIILTGYTISPALPAGLTFSSPAGTISGTPTAVTATANYTVTAYNAAGSSTATVNIKVNAMGGMVAVIQDIPVSDSTLNAPIVLSGLSPNGDGRNDVLTITNIEKYPDNKLSIISRGGAEVYYAAGYDNQNKVFDGHSSKTRQLQQAGTYFYRLEYKDNGKLKYKTGYIILKY